MTTEPRPIGIGLTENFALREQDVFVRETAGLGYRSLWTTESTKRDSTLTLLRWWEMAPTLKVGVGVLPVLIRSPHAIALTAGTLAELTGGNYILGLGTGSIHGMYPPPGTPDYPAISMMRDYVNLIRAFLTCRPVEYVGRALPAIHGARLTTEPPPPPVPIYLATLGPQMLRLAGEVADGILMNFASSERVGWARAGVAEGADRAGRDPAAVTIAAYVRITVDDDIDLARRTLTKHLLGYADSPPYRAHFDRMGMKEAIDEAFARRDRGAAPDEVADAVPGELVLRCGYFGRAAGAAAAMRALAEGLDLPIVRIIPARPGDPVSIRAVMESCQPAAWEGV